MNIVELRYIFMLEELGLTKDADTIYRTMLAEPGLSVEGLGDRLGIPEARVRRGLDELVRFSLARESQDLPGRLRAVSPDVGLSAMLLREEADLAERQQRLAERKALVTQRIADYAEVATVGYPSERLMGMDAILERLERLGREVRQECLSVMPGGAQSEASLNASRPLDSAALERGVCVLTLYQDSVRNDPATFGYARWLTDLGGQVRTAPLLPPRMLIFDRMTAVVPVDPGNTRLGALCTSEPAIVASLVMIYEQAWDMAVPLGAATEPHESGLTALERELLKLLATGMTDEAAGHRLSLSARTVRRQMAGLMERLGASSRFEAGLRAAQRGWL
jgi:sugar-specific transcriptional regulator TrmB/DNA-binding CsgD family transcriptional regulator